MASEDNVAELPPFLARHFQLGFQVEDLEAVIEAIDASQNAQYSSLPHIPAEVLCMVLDHVPVDLILPWRLVCRAFRDYVDGPLLFQYMQRAVLVGHFPVEDIGGYQSYQRYHDQGFKFLRARFEKAEMPSIQETHSMERSPSWKASHAIFRVDPDWMESEEIPASARTSNRFLVALNRLQLIEDEESFGTLRWCIGLDKAVGELCFPIEAARDFLSVDVHNGRLRIEWKDVLFRFLKTEASFRKKVEEKQGSDFTFGRQDDCLRAVRRERLSAALDHRNAAHGRINWEMNLLPPLFGRPCRDKVAASIDRLSSTEDEAIRVLLRLRREFSMSRKEVDNLLQLQKDREEMEKSAAQLCRSTMHWQRALAGLDLPNRNCYDQVQLPYLPSDIYAWTAKQRKTEESRMLKWKTQKNVIKEVVRLLDKSMSAMFDYGPDDLYHSDSDV